MPRRYALIFAALPLTMLTFSAVAMATSAPRSASTTHDILSGTWQVSRTCLTGCVLNRTTTTVVTPQGHNVYQASSLQPMEMYQISPKQVLVYAPSASSIVTVVTPGKYMTALGVGKDGETFKSVWRCSAGPVSSSGKTKSTC